MPTNMRRMTIIVPDEVEGQLDILKKRVLLCGITLRNGTGTDRYRDTEKAERTE